MANPCLIFESVFDTDWYADGTISSDSEAAGWPDDNVADWRIETSYRWKANDTTSPTYVRVDLGAGNTANPTTMVIQGHNLFSASARYKVMYSSDNFSADNNDAFSEVTPSDNSIQVQTFTATAARYWQVYIDKAAGSFDEAPQIGSIILGRRLELDYGVQPGFDAYGEEIIADLTVNEGGTPLGGNLRYVKKAFSLDYDVSAAMSDADWFDAGSGLNFDDDFVGHLENVKPFYFCWEIDSNSADTYLCKLRGAFSTPFANTTARRELHIAFDGYKEVL